MNRQLKVAVIGAGRRGINASDILTKSVVVRVDIIERNLTHVGLISYGVAPDHPRIKEIVKALNCVLTQNDIRFFDHVNYSTTLNSTTSSSSMAR
jgi:ferredoxin--NADP+ reductase